MDMHRLSARLRQIEHNKLYEGLTLTEAKSVKLWEHAGRLIKEANLTPDQIQQIFTSVEQSATAAGGNRTMIGKGKDAAEAIKKAYDDLVSKVQTSGPVKGADAMYDRAVANIEAGLGGPDNAINQVIQKYRKFAKEHPIAQSLIYAILIAAAGISGVGLGGAAVLGLLKMTDKLLQGEKFSTAVGKGLATGATAYAAGQIGQALKGTPQDAPVDGGQAVTQAAQVGGRAARDAVLKGAMDAADEAIRAGTVTDYNSMTDTVGEIMSRYEGTAPISPQSLQTIEQMIRTKLMASMGGITNGVANNAVRESVKLSEAQVQQVFSYINDTVIIEGIMDKVKQFGKNLTTKITADKLNKAWEKANSPTDSEEVAKVLQTAGVDPAMISQVFTSMSLPAPTVTASTPPAPGVSLPTTPINTADILAQILKLSPEDQQQVLVYLKK